MDRRVRSWGEVHKGSYLSAKSIGSILSIAPRVSQYLALFRPVFVEECGDASLQGLEGIAGGGVTGDGFDEQVAFLGAEFVVLLWVVKSPMKRRPQMALRRPS